MSGRPGPGRRDGGGWPHVIVLDPHSAGLALGRRMVRDGARVTFVLQPNHAWESHSRGIESFLLDFGDGSERLALLHELAERHGPAVVLPATDDGCEQLVHAREELPAGFAAWERSGHGQLALMEKESADAIARAAGVNVPWTAALHTPDELDAALERAPWPCVAKPILSHVWRARYGEVRVFVVDGPDAARELLRRPLGDGVGMLLCQYVPGADDAVEEAIVVRLADGSYPVEFGCRKLRQHPQGFGATALGVADPLPETTAIARRVLDEAGFVGVAGVETKRHAETGERWFLEVNVRMPGQWGLGDAAGVDASRRMIAALLGRELGPQPPLRSGRRIIVPTIDLAACRRLVREAPPAQRPALLLKLARPYPAAIVTGEAGLLSPRDPGPGVAWFRELAARRVPARSRTPR